MPAAAADGAETEASVLAHSQRAGSLRHKNSGPVLTKCFGSQEKRDCSFGHWRVRVLFEICQNDKSMKEAKSMLNNTAHAHYVRHPPRNRRPAPFVEFRQSLTSQVAAISPFVDRFMRFVKPLIRKFGDTNEHEVEIEMALREALANALIHGNREDPNKCVYVTSRFQMDGEFSITVRDEGQGFNTRAVPDPTDPNNRMLTHGRGIHFMRAFMDEVSFEENGRVVRMRKKLANRPF